MPSQFVSVQPPCGLPTTTMWPVFGSGSAVGKEMSGFLTFIKTQNMIAAECENAINMVCGLRGGHGFAHNVRSPTGPQAVPKEGPVIKSLVTLTL